MQTNFLRTTNKSSRFRWCLIVPSNRRCTQPLFRWPTYSVPSRSYRRNSSSQPCPPWMDPCRLVPTDQVRKALNLPTPTCPTAPGPPASRPSTATLTSTLMRLRPLIQLPAGMAARQTQDLAVSRRCHSQIYLQLSSYWWFKSGTNKLFCLLLVSRFMGSGGGMQMGMSPLGVMDAKGMQFPMSQRRKRRVLFTQAQVMRRLIQIS